MAYNSVLSSSMLNTDQAKSDQFLILKEARAR